MTQPQQPSDARPDGAAGSGKTYSVSTLIECGLDVFILGCEPRFLESIEAAIKERNLPIDKLHWSHVYPATVGWDTLITQVRTIGSMPYESLSKIKTMTGKDQYQQFVEVYRALSNFKDERTGKSFGPTAKTCSGSPSVVFGARSGLRGMPSALRSTRSTTGGQSLRM